MADSKRPTLSVDERPEHGSRAVRRLRRTGHVPGIVYGGAGGDCVSFKVDARVLRKVLVDGSALIDLEIGGTKTRPSDRQGPAASPGARRCDAHRPARGPAGREDPGAGGRSHRGRRGGARREGGRRDGAGRAPAQDRGAAHRHSRLHHRRRVRHRDRRDHAPLGARPRPRASTSSTTPRRRSSPRSTCPTEVRGADEIEEETELVGEEGEAAEGEEAEGDEGAATTVAATPRRRGLLSLFRRRSGDGGEGPAGRSTG